MDSFRAALEKAGSQIVDPGIGAGDFYAPNDAAAQQKGWSMGRGGSISPSTSTAGHDPDYSAKGVATMLKHVFNMCHVKDSVENQKGQEVKVDLGRMFALARESSYHGYYSMEFDTNAGDPIPGTKRLVQQTLKYLA